MVLALVATLHTSLHSLSGLGSMEGTLLAGLCECLSVHSGPAAGTVSCSLPYAAPQTWQSTFTEPDLFVVRNSLFHHCDRLLTVHMAGCKAWVQKQCRNSGAPRREIARCCLKQALGFRGLNPKP